MQNAFLEQAMQLTYFLNLVSRHDIPRGLMARIPGFHPGGPGSIPGVGEYNTFLNKTERLSVPCAS